MRLFVAAELPEDLRARLRALQQDLRAVLSGVRWVRPEGIHLTFVFLGEVASERLDAIRRAIGSAARTAPPPFRLRARGLGAFPERGRIRVVWIGIEGDRTAAASLKRALDEALAPAGFVPEEREFRPHLTLGRARLEGPPPDRSRLDGAIDLGEFPVEEMHLFESRLEPGGARYLPLASFPLGTAP